MEGQLFDTALIMPGYRTLTLATDKRHDQTIYHAGYFIKNLTKGRAVMLCLVHAQLPSGESGTLEDSY